METLTMIYRRVHSLDYCEGTVIETFYNNNDGTQYSGVIFDYGLIYVNHRSSELHAI